MTVISQINNVEDIKSYSCNKADCNIWGFYITEKQWMSAVHMSDITKKKDNNQCRILGDVRD